MNFSLKISEPVMIHWSRLNKIIEKQCGKSALNSLKIWNESEHFLYPEQRNET